MTNLPTHFPGEVYVTRNLDNSTYGNPSPGYWNHVAIYVGNDLIVEGQDDPINAVVRSQLESFRNRYPQFIRLRPKNLTIGVKAARFALSLVGTKYRKIASIFYILRKARRGENCVSVVRKSYANASGKDGNEGVPDSFLDSPLFTRVEEKKLSKDFVEPKNWFEGILDYKP